MPEALRRAPLCTHGVSAASSAAMSTVEGHALLDRLLEELHLKERCVDAMKAQLEELRGQCLRLAVRLGRHDLLQRQV